MHTRPAVPDDAAAMGRLAGELGYPSSESEMRERLRLVAEYPDLHDVFVVETPPGTVMAWVHAQDWARGQGMTRLRVRSNVIRGRAHRFYLRLGFERVKSQAVFDKSLGGR